MAATGTNVLDIFPCPCLDDLWNSLVAVQDCMAATGTNVLDIFPCPCLDPLLATLLHLSFQLSAPAIQANGIPIRDSTLQDVGQVLIDITDWVMIILENH